MNGTSALSTPTHGAGGNSISRAVEAFRRRVRILFIVDQLTEMGGAERQLIKLIRSLPTDRFQCSLVTFKLDDRLPLFSSLPCDVQVLGLRKSYDVHALRLSLELRRLIKREGVDIVHTFFETADLWGGLVSRLSGIRVLLSSRRDMGILRRPKHAFAYKLVNPLFSGVLAVSDEVRRYCIEVDGLNPADVKTVYNGVELRPAPTETREVLRERLRLQDFSKIILTIGNIRRVKGIDIFLRACEEVCRIHPTALFLVVGDNHEPAHFEELMRLVDELNISRNVRFYGPSEEIAQFLSVADVFCLPSRSEGFSNALIEAMGTGLASVATQVGGNGEAIDDGVNGVLVPPENGRALASAISKLLDDPKWALRLGQNAIETVRARFTHEAMMTQLINIYETQVEQAGR